MYSVVLNKRLDDAELDRLSERIKKATPKSELIFIAFYLRGMAEDRDAWAASIFNSGAERFVVRIKEANLQANPPDADLRIAAKAKQ